MTPERQRIAISEWCGWKKGNCGWWEGPQGQETPYLPDYVNDLNAIHEAEKRLSIEEKTDYIRHLNRGDFSYRRMAFATAAQRTEALIRTIGKWED